MEQNKKPARNKTTYFIVNMIIQFFVETFVSMGIGYFLGRFIDTRLFEDKLVFTYIFIVLGIFAGISNLIKRALKYSGGGEENEKD